MSFFGTSDPPNEPLHNFDNELQYFYHKLLSLILENEKTQQIVIETLKQERINRIRKDNSQAALQITAHLFRYGPCYSSAVASHLLRMVKNNPYIFKDALLKRCVNICCFGSASIIEIVSICKIFNLADQSFWRSSKKPLALKVTVFGNNHEWKKTVDYAVQVLMKTKNIFDSSKMKISVRISKASPAKVLNNSVIDIVKQADLITMVKFVCLIRLDTFAEQLLWEIADSMKINSVLFFLETDMYPHCKIPQRVFDPLDHMENIFGPNIIEPFTLNINAIQKCVKLFWTKFQNNICLTSGSVSSAAWIKTDANSESKETHKTLESKKASRKDRGEQIMDAKREWYEKQLITQRTLEEYHLKVRRVIPRRNANKKQDDGSIRLFDYPKLERSVLFKSKPKEKRIFLR